MTRMRVWMDVYNKVTTDIKNSIVHGLNPLSIRMKSNTLGLMSIKQNIIFTLFCVFSPNLIVLLASYVRVVGDRPIIWPRCGSYHSLLFKLWTLCIFEPPFGALRDNVRCLSWAHWKARRGLPISVNWTFFTRCYSWGAVGENYRKLAISLQCSQFTKKFQVEGDVPTVNFCMDS